MDRVLTYNWKDHEVFSALRMPKHGYYIIRCDGRNFHRLTDTLNFNKPYDRKFAELMVDSTLEVFRSGLNPCLAYIFSDEVNLLFLDLPFNGRIEKILSIVPSILSSAFTLNLHERMGVGSVVSFDSRIILLTRELLYGYLCHRQMEAWRNHNNSYAYFTLISKGYKPRDASRMLRGLKTSQIHELVFKMAGINLSRTPCWQRRGILVRYVLERKYGYDPLRNVKVETFRRRLRVEWEIPMFHSEDGCRLIQESISSFTSPPSMSQLPSS